MATTGRVYQMATTMTLAGIVATQIGTVFNCRTERASVFKVGFFTNRLVISGIAFELVLLAILIYTPFLHALFNTAPIGLVDWAYLFMWIPLVILLDESRKAVLRKWEQHASERQNEIRKGESK